MKDFYLYILQVNVALAAFWLLYRLLYVRDTFLEMRRACLLVMLVIAFGYPFISFSHWLNPPEVFQAIAVNYVNLVAVNAMSPAVAETASFWTLEHILVGIWFLGGGMLLCRMLIQLGIVVGMAVKGEKRMCYGMQVIAVSRAVSPFSFGRWIFINLGNHSEEDLQEIIVHERTHVQQWHSIDMILSECLSVLFWFNPIVWFLRMEIRQNLEFLADRKVVLSGCNRKNYQYHLLRLSYQPTAVQIVNNFNVSPLKKRIMMMNKKKTSRLGLMKYALLLPVTGLLALSGNANAVVKMTGDVIKDHTAVLTSLPDSWVQSVAKEKIECKGVVKDEAGKALPGATVLIQNTHIGTSTDKKGYFRISCEPGSVLSISYVGKKPVSLPVESKEMEIILKNDVAYLDRLVVTGYAAKPVKARTAEGTVVEAYTAKPCQPKGDERKETFIVVEEMPKFLQGNIQSYLAKHVRYPAKAQEAHQEGVVFVSFIIDKTGRVVNPKVERSVAPALDKEALRVVSEMPVWQPGKQRGQAVDVEYMLPIAFSLVDGSSAGNDIKQLAETAKKTNTLIVIDGVMKGKGYDISHINPNLIKSVTVLKDASARMIYGEAGKDGVIVIETQKSEK